MICITGGGPCPNDVATQPASVITRIVAFILLPPGKDF
jgi:hypothetical protein